MHLSKWHTWTSVVLFVVILLTPAALRAQANGNDKEQATTVIQSMAKSIYFLAWPTATYRSVSFSGMQLVPNGLDVYVTLSGLSGFDQSDLWLKLAITIAHGTIANVRVIGHNALIREPFATTKDVAGALATAAAQQKGPPLSPTAPQITPVPVTPAGWAAAVCISNATGGTVPLQFRWGSATWDTATIPNGKVEALWWPYPSDERSSPQLQIRYDDDFAPGYTERNYDLGRTQTQLPVSCSGVMNYTLQMAGNKIVVVAQPAP